MFSKLFGRRPVIDTTPIEIEGSGDFSADIVGESHYQDNLHMICGGYSPNGHELYCSAELRHEPSNPVDSNAVAVYIRGRKVGFVPAYIAPEISAALNGRIAKIEAVIVGGWKRSDTDVGHFGVRLDF
ncbi:HIRAN domain-containing protein [Phaeobacter sp. 22II1-1F12B]|uniref:HIRAN domain-containing protein n=1 Tax=Phaeobacter sp. 22II1-1F12B TaxID=1317111 RepID=UPI000B51EA10|nr:HIRAN domain-containing protein [Phaeobacter sp. 22II1-1F12B]OWU80448.1 hypothetical protein ATO1_08870 [Phaeobacter sp. 22II1-1F12B]